MSIQTVSLQLKHRKQTFIVTVKSQPTALAIKQELLSIIKAVGGLKEGEATEDEDVPVPTFGDDSDDGKVEEAEATGKIPALEEIVLGEPKDVSDVYAGFKDIQEEKTVLGVRDFAIVAFRLFNEKFQVVAPVAED